MSVFGLEGSVLLAALSPAAWYNIGLVVVLVALAIAGVMAYHVWHEVNEEIEPATPEELAAALWSRPASVSRQVSRSSGMSAYW